jgi:hypothetical protein
MKEQEVRSKSLETYKKFNKLTLAGAIGVAVFVPVLAVPALGLAAIDAGQIYAVNKLNKKKEAGSKQGEKVIFSKSKVK